MSSERGTSVAEMFARNSIPNVVEEGGLFRKKFARQGPLYLTVGGWMSQTGGALGYGIRDHPVTLGKLLGQHTDHASEYVQNTLWELATEIVALAREGESLREVFVGQVLAEEGLKLEPNAEWMSMRIHDFKIVWLSAQAFFRRGAAVGFHFPNEFRGYWASAHRPHSKDEWDKFDRMGIVTAPEQDVLSLEDHVRDVLADCADWMEETAPSQFTREEASAVREMATDDPRFLAADSELDESLAPASNAEEPPSSEVSPSGETEGTWPDHCTNCGQEVGRQMTYCPTCGAKLVQ